MLAREILSFQTLKEIGLPVGFFERRDFFATWNYSFAGAFCP